MGLSPEPKVSLASFQTSVSDEHVNNQSKEEIHFEVKKSEFQNTWDNWFLAWITTEAAHEKKVKTRFFVLPSLCLKP